MDEEILNTIHSRFGKNVNIVDCEKKFVEQEEETLLVNGVPIKLDNLSGDKNAIKTALQNGQIPSIDVFNEMLLQAGIQKQEVQLETSISVKSIVTTKEEISISRKGKTLENQKTETQENYLYESKQKESLQPFIKKNNGKDCNNLKTKFGSNATFAKDSTTNIKQSEHLVTSNNPLKTSFSNSDTNASYSNISEYSTMSANSSTDLENHDSAIGDLLETYNLSDHSKKSTTSCDSGHHGDVNNISDLEMDTTKLISKLK
ncbi:uncharacterized protein LOC119679232 [Teleopsis dalmanni]|uniref:uncharacterized protein LOC119679232 n=1 Tax=Teleopsis dalmanni TaxID=139649 RepID=UPI0018CD0048|nr:uncharacterized protein LOC119679232 [Teleopsis dalmanni]